jgi:hypothetical protein
MKPSYNYCGICGFVPGNSALPEYQHNIGPIRWWDPDDGWKIGTLCFGCREAASGVKPKPRDFAFQASNGIADAIDTDEDVTHLIPWK